MILAGFVQGGQDDQVVLNFTWENRNCGKATEVTEGTERTERGGPQISQITQIDDDDGDATVGRKAIRLRSVD